METHGKAPKEGEESKKNGPRRQAGETETIDAGAVVRKAGGRAGALARAEWVPVGPRANPPIAANLSDRGSLRSCGSPRKRERCQVRGRDGRPALADCLSFANRAGRRPLYRRRSNSRNPRQDGPAASSCFRKDAGEGFRRGVEKLGTNQSRRAPHRGEKGEFD